MKPMNEGERREAEAMNHFLGLARERQMSTFLPSVAYLSQEELKVLFQLAQVSVRRTEKVHEPAEEPPPSIRLTNTNNSHSRQSATGATGAADTRPATSRTKGANRTTRRLLGRNPGRS